VLALKGTQNNFERFAEVSFTITTESRLGGDHDVFFNRGAAASHEYARQFGNRKPEDMGGDVDPAWTWLSRRAHEAMLEFIVRAKSSSWGLSVCAYEFRLPSVSEAIKSEVNSDADLRVIYDGSKEFPDDENRQVVSDAGVADLRVKRVPKPIARKTLPAHADVGIAEEYPHCSDGCLGFLLHHE
jgi:hypothetical protein